MMPDFVYDKAAVGARIQEKRLALRLTQENVAEKLDKSLRLVTEIERGAVGMSIETLLSMCEILKTTPNELLLPQEDTTNTELDWLVGALTNASEHVRTSAIDIVRSYLRST
jgi:transcriptional regulator with XRE-family HTH domain